MKKNLLFKSSLFMLGAFASMNLTAQETETEKTSWIAPLQIRIGRSNNLGFNGGLNATGASSEGDFSGSPRVGLGYSVKLSDRFTIAPAVDIQGSNYSQLLEFSGESNPSNEPFNNGDSYRNYEAEFIVSLPVSYAFYTRPKSSLSVVLGPEFYIGPYSKSVTNFSRGIIGSEINYESVSEQRDFRAAVATGLNYDVKLGRMPLRVQALYSHSLTDQARGSYTYSNEFTGENQTGSYAFKGHQFTASLQFSPFGNGKAKKQGVENVKRVRNTGIGSTRFGIRGGVDFNSIDAIDRINSRDSGFAGTYGYGSLFADTRISEQWNLQVEMGVAFAGDSYLLAENALLFKRRISERFLVLGGPKVQYLLSADSSTLRASNTIGLSLALGLQYDINDNIFLEARYSRGLSNQFNDPNFEFESGKLNSLQIGVGFKF